RRRAGRRREPKLAASEEAAADAEPGEELREQPGRLIQPIVEIADRALLVVEDAEERVAPLDGGDDEVLLVDFDGEGPAGELGVALGEVGLHPVVEPEDDRLRRGPHGDAKARL